MKISNAKKNQRRKFFNSAKPHCSTCGSLLVTPQLTCSISPTHVQEK